ncbi:EamA family transporter [Bacillus sp. AK128]
MSKLARSIEKNKIGILFILCASISTAIGQLLWKLSSGLLNISLIGGFIFYFIGAVLMIIAFRFGSLSVLHPLLSTGYIFALFLGIWFLKETITLSQLIGIGLIVIGAILIGGGDD